jgi:hypothetical protein
VEVQVDQLQDVGDLVASDLALGRWRADTEDLINIAALRSLAGQAMGLEVASDTGVGRTRHDRINAGQHDAQVVVEEFDVPGRMARIQRAQRLGGLRADTGE